MKKYNVPQTEVVKMVQDGNLMTVGQGTLPANFGIQKMTAIAGAAWT